MHTTPYDWQSVSGAPFSMASMLSCVLALGYLLLPDGQAAAARFPVFPQALRE
jgi:hypothetical protein